MGEADTVPAKPVQTVSETATSSMVIALPETNSNPNPSWFGPKRLLAIFCVINMLNYLDRGAIASNGVNGSRGGCSEKGICTSGSGIQGEFDLNNFKDGVLSSAFMVGLLVASPIFASLAKSHNPFRLIGVGLIVWTIATAGCGCSFDFWSITICRMLVGVGEASFISLAAPFIDDNAPVDQKNAWLALFYMCIPTGIAVGYVYGGLVGNHLHWRFAFWGESILMLPFAILGFVIKPLELKGFASSESSEGQGYGKMTVPEVQDEQNSNIEISAGDRVKGDDAAMKKVFLYGNNFLYTNGNAQAAVLIESWYANGKFYSGEAYSLFRQKKERTAWYKIVWDAVVVPKHSIIGTLALQNALPTIDNLKRKGIQCVNRCILCQKQEETVQHLLFSCEFSRRVLVEIKRWVRIRIITCNLRQIMWLLRKNFKKKDWKHKLYLCALLALIYGIWQERNQRIFEGRVKSLEQLVWEIKFVISVRMLHCGGSKPMESRLSYLLGA